MIGLVLIMFCIIGLGFVVAGILSLILEQQFRMKELEIEEKKSEEKNKIELEKIKNFKH